MKNVQNYTSLPTTSNGTLKAGIWLTSLNEDVLNGDIVVNSVTLPDTIEVTVNGTVHNPEVLPLLIAGFERCYGSKAQLTVLEHIKLAEAGFITPLQQNTIVSVTKESKPLGNSKSVLSASQYYTNCLKLGLDNKNVDTIDNHVSRYYAITDKSTKADIYAILTDLVHIFFNQNQYDTHARMLEAEVLEVKRLEELAKRFIVLQDAGITEIKEFSGKYTGIVALPDVSKAAIALNDAGLILTETKLTNDMQSMVITFNDISKT
jgi:hypothetical protein